MDGAQATADTMAHVFERDRVERRPVWAEAGV